MSLAKIASVVRDMKEDVTVRDAVARGEMLTGFTAEERESLQALATRLQTGAELPKHLRSESALRAVWI